MTNQCETTLLEDMDKRKSLFMDHLSKMLSDVARKFEECCPHS